MLFTEFSRFARFTKDVKYISPGSYKGWKEKHKGIVKHVFYPYHKFSPAILGLDHREYGWDVISSVRCIRSSHLQIVWPITSSRLPCGQLLGEASLLPIHM